MSGRQLLRIFRPADVTAPPVVFWVTTTGPGQVQMCDASCRVLAAASGAAVVTPDLTEGPPALGDVRAVLRWLARDGWKRRLDGARLAAIGDDDLGPILECRGDQGVPSLRAALMLASSVGGTEVLRGAAGFLAAALRTDLTPEVRPA